MTLDDRTARLIAVGASITANCQPCLDMNVGRALKAGASPQDIADAIEVGKMVRHGAARTMDRLAAGLVAAPPSPLVADGECGCGS